MSNSVCKKFLDTLIKLGLYKRPVIRGIAGSRVVVYLNGDEVKYITEVIDEAKE